MSSVVAAFWNPIVAKEYRSRMRTWRSPLAMMVYVALIAGLGYLMFSSMVGPSFGPSGQASTYGQQLFKYLVVFQMILVTFIAPALTAGAISSERERQTIDLLFVTRIAPFSIIWGKLLASMSFVVLLLLLSVPIFSLVFLFGGVELDQVLYCFLITLAAALTLGLLGVAFSTLLRRTLAATVASYVTAFVIVFGTLGYGLIFPTLIDQSAPSSPAPPAVTYLSPIMPLVALATNAPPLTGYFVRYKYQTGPVYNSGSTICKGNVCQTTGGGTVTVSSGKGGATPVDATAMPSGLFQGWQYWQASVALYAAICVVALLVSAFLLPPVRRLPWRRRSAAAPA